MKERTPEQIEALHRARQVALRAPSGELFDLDVVHAEKPCGTAHCFLGWLGEDKWFGNRINHSRHNPSFSKAGYCLGLTDKEIDILFAVGEEVNWSRKTGDEAKVRVIHNVDRLISGQRPLRYRSKTWRTLDLTALRAEVVAASRPEAAS